ncbi:MAG: hypothetical protein MUC36_08065 [Planctomycetes bacterium]|nr:hypothetical protein [Planctomycetota bacterium]
MPDHTPYSPAMLLLLCCVFDALALGIGSLLVLRQPWRGVRTELIATAVAAGLVLGAISAVTLSGGGFALMRGWTHGLFCVLLPLLALRAIRVRRQAPRLATLWLTLAALGTGCYVWARRVEPFRLEVTTAVVTSPRLHGLPSPVRLAVVADLQTDAIGSYEVSVFDRLVELAPDLILFLGDYLQLDAEAGARELPALHTQLARLRPRLGMFAVDGDVDGALGGAAQVFAGTAVKVLNDASASLDGVPIDLHGLSRTRSRAPFLDAGIVRRLPGERFPILFGHAPDFMQAVLRGGLDTDALMLAGHTHGGQVQIPGFGPLVTLSSVPRWLAGGGVFQRGASWLVCSRGIGMERGHAPRIRFACRPQLIVLELQAPAANADRPR